MRISSPWDVACGGIASVTRNMTKARQMYGIVLCARTPPDGDAAEQCEGRPGRADDDVCGQAAAGHAEDKAASAGLEALCERGRKALRRMVFEGSRTADVDDNDRRDRVYARATLEDPGARGRVWPGALHAVRGYDAGACMVLLLRARSCVAPDVFLRSALSHSVRRRDVCIGRAVGSVRFLGDVPPPGFVSLTSSLLGSCCRAHCLLTLPLAPPVVAAATPDAPAPCTPVVTLAAAAPGDPTGRARKSSCEPKP